MTRVDELEAEIRARPDDVELRAVHADAVLERGEAGDRNRGQLIQLALAGERGDLGAARKAWTMQRKARARLVNAIDRKYVLGMTWKHGSVESISIELRAWSGATALHQARTTAALVELFAEPEVFALRKLDTRPAGDGHVEAIFELVKHLPIRWLGFAGACPSPADLALVRSLPHLDGLGIHTHEPDAVIALLAGQPWLRDLELSTGVRGPQIEQLMRGCPQLARLVLYAIDVAHPELEPILDGVLPELRELGVLGTVEVTSWMLRRLAASPLLPRLRSLGFCAATLYDDPAERDWLVEHRAAFAHVSLFTTGYQPDHDRGFEAGRLGLFLDRMGRTREAIDAHQHHLDHSGSDRVHAGCWGQLANALITDEQYAEALRAIDRGIDVMGEGHQDAAYLLRTRMWALQLLERHPEAVVAAERALAVDSKHPWAWRMLGDSLVELGRFDDAMAAFDRSVAELVEGTSNSVIAWTHLRRGELRWGRRDDTGALEDIARVLSIVEPTDYVLRRRAQLVLGSIAYRRRDFAAARPYFVEALGASHSSETAAISAVCASLFELGQLPLALTTWQIAASQFEWSDIEQQGHVLIAMGRPADALVALSQGLETGGARAMALHALGKTDEAVAALDNFAIKPRHPDPACAARFASGHVLQGLLLHDRHPREAAAHFAQLRELPADPVELHASTLRRLRGHDTSTCHAENCAGQAAIAVLAAAIATHDRGRIDALVRAFVAYDATQLIDHPQLWWDLRSALALSPSPLLAAALATLEYGAATQQIVDALG